MNDIILESISDGVFTVDLDWKITFFNNAAERITGIKRSKAIGRFCCEIFKSNMCETECPLRKTMKSGKPAINRSGFIIDLEGNRIPISISTALLRDGSGKVIGGAETFRDLSEIEELKNELKGKSVPCALSSHSPSMARILEILPAIAESPSTVLIEGETGTGKEVLARIIHNESPRAKKPFIPLNCGALPDTLLESELFGYKKGSFTGADKDKPGRFALAEGGTLFLDEIGEISSVMQVKLLRVLQEKEYEPLGATRSEKTDVRIIAATHRDIPAMIKEGQFRQDLYYRINIIRIELPPLRMRKEDIPFLAEYFLKRFNNVQNKNISGFSPEVFSLFYSYSWPGNIRELENVVERASVLCQKKAIEKECLPSELFSCDTIISDSESIRSVRQISEKQSIVRCLEKNLFNRTSAAKDLGIDKTTLYRKIKAYGIPLPERNGRNRD